MFPASNKRNILGMICSYNKGKYEKHMGYWIGILWNISLEKDCEDEINTFFNSKRMVCSEKISYERHYICSIPTLQMI